MYQSGNKHETYENQITNGGNQIEYFSIQKGFKILKGCSLLVNNTHFVLHDFFAKLFSLNEATKPIHFESKKVVALVL